MAHRQFTDTELVLATHNVGKVKEITDLLQGYVETFYSAGELDLPEPEETGKTFAENALLKARIAAHASGKVALADDSGLSVRALDGAPGIYSARWGGQNKDFNVAMQRVHDELSGQDDRSAAFICVLALAWPDGHTEHFEGIVKGTMHWPPRGQKGFGYDPIFMADGHDITFAEMNPHEKHAISHRADAFQKMIKACF